MARKPDTLCAGGCGTLLWGGKGALPPGQRTCRQCRSAQTDATCAQCSAPFRRSKPDQRTCSRSCGQQLRMASNIHVCEVCSVQYRPSYSGQRTCGRKCGEQLRRTITGTLSCKPKPPPKVYTCTVCGREIRNSAARTVCGAECKRAHARAYSNARYQQYKPNLLVTAHRRHARLKQQYVEDVDLAVLYERDRGRCGVCRKRVPPLGSTGKRDPRMGSIDHVVPISQGGEHSYANTRLTHYRCNLVRHDGGGNEQLALIG